MTTSAAQARTLWELFEPLHAVTYFSEESRQAAEDLRFPGFWMGYFAFRSAPLGPVDAPVVTALFHGFAPRRVARALPDAWRFATPAVALSVRRAAAGRALRRLLPGADVGQPADLLWEAVGGADTAGRVLAAANVALPVPADPFERLWQATTVLREHRGDGHVAALVAADVSPVEAHLLKAAAGESPGDRLRVGRSWTDDEWAAGVESLRGRGWTDGEGRLTEAGAAARRDVEDRTDAAAAGPWRALGVDRTGEVAELLRPLAREVVDAGELPYPNPIGLSAPAAPA